MGTAWEQEDEDDWTRKAEEAKKTAKAKANKSPLAKRWDKKNPAGLQAFGFVGPKTRYAPAEKADSPPNAAQSEQPLLRCQFPFQMYCYMTMDLQGGDDGIKTTVAVAEKNAEPFDTNEQDAPWMCAAASEQDVEGGRVDQSG